MKTATKPAKTANSERNAKTTKPAFYKANPTLAEWANYWLETYVKPATKPGGYESYHDNMVKHILPFLGDVKLSKLSTGVVQRFLNEQAEHGNLRDNGPLSAKSLKNIRVVLDVCCKRAVVEEFMDANPVPATVLLRCRTKRVDVMTDADQAVLEDYLRDYDSLSCLDAGIMLGMHTGMRLGEVCALKWGHYDPREGCLYVQETIRRISNYDENAPYGSRTSLVTSPVKSDASERKIYLPGFLLDLMDAQYDRFVRMFRREPDREDYVIFSDRGGCIDPDNLSHYFSDLLRTLRLPHVKYHALRHTFATRAVESGIDIATVSGILGHADVTTTTHFYVHPRDESMRRAMTSMQPVTGYRRRDRTRRLA